MKAMGDYFIFNNINSENYNIVIGSDSAVEDVSFGLNRTIIKSEVNKYREKVTMLGTTNDETISFEFIMLKDPCIGISSYFTTEELRQILAWITSPHYPRLFKWGDKNKTFKRHRVSAQGPSLTGGSGTGMTSAARIGTRERMALPYGPCPSISMALAK